LFASPKQASKPEPGDANEQFLWVVV
jgi:hypothetical protein